MEYSRRRRVGKRGVLAAAGPPTIWLDPTELYGYTGRASQGRTGRRVGSVCDAFWSGAKSEDPLGLVSVERKGGGMGISPLCFDAYILENVVGTRILDVGCGHGKWGYLLKKYAPPHSPRQVVGLDAFAPHVAALQREGIYDQVLVGKASSLPFEDKSFDSIVVCEVLAHLPRPDADQLIAECRRVARHCFIVTVPHFHCQTGVGRETLNGFSEYEEHRYNYSYREFSRFGFTQIIGLGRLNLRPWKLSVGLSSLGYYFPHLSRYLMGFWFADGKKRHSFSD